MSTKNNPGEFDCYANALPDEPMFILLARDPIAPALIMRWAWYRQDQIERGERPKSDMQQVKEALKCATDMNVWLSKNEGKWRK